MTDISIITTLFNCEDYVEESLESIRSQEDPPDYEWLILNDGSEDLTWEKTTKFIDNHDFPGEVRLIDDNSNIRIPRRRNQAIGMARGKYITIHDGDDSSLPRRLRDEFDFLEAHSDIFCVGGHAIRMGLDSEPDGVMSYPMDTHDRIVRQLYKKVNPMIDPTTMFRRKDFLDLDGYTLDESIYTVPDMDLWCRAILSGRKMANIRRPMINYRVNPDGMTGLHKEAMIKAHMTVWREFARVYREKIRHVRKEYYEKQW